MKPYNSLKDINKDTYLLYFIMGAISIWTIGTLLCNTFSNFFEYSCKDMSYIFIGMALWGILCFLSSRFYHVQIFASLLILIILFIFSGIYCVFSYDNYLLIIGVIVIPITCWTVGFRFENYRKLCIGFLILSYLLINFFTILYYTSSHQNFNHYFSESKLSFSFFTILLYSLSIFVSIDFLRNRKRENKKRIPTQYALIYFLNGWIGCSLLMIVVEIGSFQIRNGLFILGLSNIHDGILFPIISILIITPLLVWQILDGKLRRILFVTIFCTLILIFCIVVILEVSAIAQIQILTSSLIFTPSIIVINILLTVFLIKKLRTLDCYQDRVMH